MSSCKAPNCNLKDFYGCSNSLTFCDIMGDDVSSDATCLPKGDDTGIYHRDEESCNIPHTSSSPQKECEEIIGCEWGYPSVSVEGSLLEKSCVPMKRDGSSATKEYTCGISGAQGGRVSVFSTNENIARHLLTEKDTFGCPAGDCEYTPMKKIRESGTCSGTVSALFDEEGVTCETQTSLNECLRYGCDWDPKDEAYCGKKRILTDQNGEQRNRRCKKITNPSEESCNYWGCIWDINGDRTGDEGVDYDKNTSGLCIDPDKNGCMNNFCSKNTMPLGGGLRNSFHPDGVCEYNPELDDQLCSPSLRKIINYRTPGLMEIPEGNSVDEIEEIGNVKIMIANKEKEININYPDDNDNTKRNKLNEYVDDLYRKVCEVRGEFNEETKSFSKNTYDYGKRECLGENEFSDTLEERDINGICQRMRKGNKEYNKSFWPTIDMTDTPNGPQIIAASGDSNSPYIPSLGSGASELLLKFGEVDPKGRCLSKGPTSDEIYNCARITSRELCNNITDTSDQTKQICEWYDPNERCKVREIDNTNNDHDYYEIGHCYRPVSSVTVGSEPPRKFTMDTRLIPVGTGLDERNTFFDNLSNQVDSLGIGYIKVQLECLNIKNSSNEQYVYSDLFRMVDPTPDVDDHPKTVANSGVDQAGLRVDPFKYDETAHDGVATENSNFRHVMLHGKINLEKEGGNSWYENKIHWYGVSFYRTQDINQVDVFHSTAPIGGWPMSITSSSAPSNLQQRIINSSPIINCNFKGKISSIESNFPAKMKKGGKYYLFPCPALPPPHSSAGTWGKQPYYYEDSDTPLSKVNSVFFRLENGGEEEAIYNNMIIKLSGNTTAYGEIIYYAGGAAGNNYVFIDWKFDPRPPGETARRLLSTSLSGCQEKTNVAEAGRFGWQLPYATLTGPPHDYLLTLELTLITNGNEPAMSLIEEIKNNKENWKIVFTNDDANGKILYIFKIKGTVDGSGKLPVELIYPEVASSLPADGAVNYDDFLLIPPIDDSSYYEIDPTIKMTRDNKDGDGDSLVTIDRVWPGGRAGISNQQLSDRVARSHGDPAPHYDSIDDIFNGSVDKILHTSRSLGNSTFTIPKNTILYAADDTIQNIVSEKKLKRIWETEKRDETTGINRNLNTSFTPAIITSLDGFSYPITDHVPINNLKKSLEFSCGTAGGEFKKYSPIGIGERDGDPVKHEDKFEKISLEYLKKDYNCNKLFNKVYDLIRKNVIKDRGNGSNPFTLLKNVLKNIEASRDIDIDENKIIEIYFKDFEGDINDDFFNTLEKNIENKEYRKVKYEDCNHSHSVCINTEECIWDSENEGSCVNGDGSGDFLNYTNGHCPLVNCGDCIIGNGVNELNECKHCSNYDGGNNINNCKLHDTMCETVLPSCSGPATGVGT